MKIVTLQCSVIYNTNFEFFQHYMVTSLFEDPQSPGQISMLYDVLADLPSPLRLPLSLGIEDFGESPMEFSCRATETAPRPSQSAKTVSSSTALVSVAG